MKKLLVLAVFLVSSTLFVFARQSAVATAAPDSPVNELSSAGVPVDVVAASDTPIADVLIAQIHALEASIAQVESLAAVVVSKPQSKTIVPTKPKTVFAPTSTSPIIVAVVEPATTSATSVVVNFLIFLFQ